MRLDHEEPVRLDDGGDARGSSTRRCSRSYVEPGASRWTARRSSLFEISSSTRFAEPLRSRTGGRRGNTSGCICAPMPRRWAVTQRCLRRRTGAGLSPDRISMARR